MFVPQVHVLFMAFFFTSSYSVNLREADFFVLATLLLGATCELKRRYKYHLEIRRPSDSRLLNVYDIPQLAVRET